MRRRPRSDDQSVRVAAFAPPADVVTAYAGVAAAWCDETRHHFHGSGLAGTVRPEEPEYLAGRALEAQLVNDRMLAVSLCQTINFYHGNL